MIIIPAIDIKGGRCVRLRQGLASMETVYSDDPAGMAKRWAGEGAEYLHVVDLDGAFEGRPVNTRIIAAIAGSAGIPVEAGGGLRTDDDIRAVLDCGADRAIVGTRAVSDQDSLSRLCGRFGRRVAVGIDARNGMVQVKGWVEASGVKATELAMRAGELGIETIIYTDTSRDGMLAGVNARAVEEICRKTRCNVIASGGVSSVADVETLSSLGLGNLTGAIVGKALYDGRVAFGDMASAARGTGAEVR